jgi:hypothetical protein
MGGITGMSIKSAPGAVPEASVPVAPPPAGSVASDAGVVDLDAVFDGSLDRSRAEPDSPLFSAGCPLPPAAALRLAFVLTLATRRGGGAIVPNGPCRAPTSDAPG